MTFIYRQFYDFNSVERYISMGLAIDGTKGGLLLGHPHSNGGIPVLIKYADGYRLMAEFEGQEYFLNPGASNNFTNKLFEINQSKTDKLLGLKQPTDLSGITVIDCFTDSDVYISKFLLIDARGSQFIVNKYSTWKNLRTLEELNNEVLFNFNGDLHKWEDVGHIDPFRFSRFSEEKTIELPKDNFIKQSMLERFKNVFKKGLKT